MRSLQARSTYRLQLGAGTGFETVTELATYLDDLGVTHVYLSPVLQAAEGSDHGYDVVDPTRPSERLGGEEAFARMTEGLTAMGIRVLLDVVPNHMAARPENAWWWDVLENGPSSAYATYFDVDWDPAGGVRNRVLLPVLPDRYGRVVSSRGVALERTSGWFVIRSAGGTFPPAPPSLEEVVREAASLARSAGSSEQVCNELEEVAAGLGALPSSTRTEAVSVRERHVEKGRLRARLVALAGADDKVEAALAAVCGSLSEDPESMDRLLERQNYRLAWWRAREEEVDWRRFFDIDTLVGVRVEDPMVFADTHSLVLSWLASGAIDGLRVDHLDGLADPSGYLDRLAEEGRSPWVVVEKILARGEQLPREMKTSGTTGYDFAAVCLRLFANPSGEEPLTHQWTAISGDSRPFHEVALEAKREVLEGSLRSDALGLSARLVAIARENFLWRDLTRAECQSSLVEALAQLDAYRTYVPMTGRCSAADAERIDRTLDRAAEALPDLDGEVWSLLRQVLEGTSEQESTAEQTFRVRFQQLSGSVMAKGIEDRALYRYVRLVSHNEVGADPSDWAVLPAEFHDFCSRLAHDHAGGLLSSSTHDTKRSEDVRARLVALSEMPEEWCGATRSWSSLLREFWGTTEPDPTAEHLLLQSLVGTWGLRSEQPPGGGEGVGELTTRLSSYMVKAAREAARRTSWTDPDEEYEASLVAVVQAALRSETLTQELSSFLGAGLAEAGWVNSLGMLALKLTCPGVPDVYQGCELWSDSLVDPDNRRPVDFTLRRSLLGDASSWDPSRWESSLRSGLPKLVLLANVLRLRRRRPEWFSLSASYRPLLAEGPGSTHVVAFVRQESSVTVVPRLVVGLARLAGSWPCPQGSLLRALSAALTGTRVDLPPGKYVRAWGGAMVEGGAVDVGELLSGFPVAVLEKVE